MTAELEALARRAVACPTWRWMPGMRWIRVRPAPLSTIVMRVAEYRPRDGWDVPAAAIPDLADPATLGCLLALVREVWGDPYLCARWSGRDWLIAQTDDRLIAALRATEAAALITALERAP